MSAGFKKGLRRGCLGLLLLLPLLVLIAFTPTTYNTCPDGAIFYFPIGACPVMTTTGHDGGVVLEVLVRWVMSSDWAGAFIAALKTIMILVALLLGLIALSYFTPEESVKDKS